MKRRYNQKRRGSKVFWIFICIIAFAFIFFPFFGNTLAYQVRSAYSSLRGAGWLLLFAGVLMIGFGLLGRCGKIILIGFVFLLVGSVLVNPFDFNFLFFRSTTKGYH